MTKSDIFIICGDFGAVWDNPESKEERYWPDCLDEKPFTTVFVDGNHENFDRLINDFAVVDFHGGKAHKISKSIYYLMRGEIFEFEGLKFFTFGGASSHDIKDGILSKRLCIIGLRTEGCLELIIYRGGLRNCRATRNFKIQKKSLKSRL